MPWVAVLVGLLTGLVVWAVLDQIQGQQVDKIFDRELESQLDLRARESLMRFEHHVAGYAAVAHLLANAPHLTAPFREVLPPDGLCPPLLSAQDLRILHLPELFGRAALSPPSHLILVDSKGCPFKRFQDPSVPMHQVPLESSADWFHPLGQAFIERFEHQPYLVLSEPIRETVDSLLGYLVVFVPIDADFLANSQRGLDVGRAAVALVEGRTQRVLASLDPQTIRLGSMLSDFSEHYVIGTQPLPISARPGSEPLLFATLVSQARLERMSRHISIFERRQRFYAAAVYVLVFTALFYLVSARLNSVLKRMTRFAQRALGIPEPGFRRSGNQLILLEEWIQHFTQLVLRARDEMSRHYQAELREREALKAAIMEAALDAILILDQRGRVVEYNPAAEQLFGLERLQTRGIPFAERFLPDSSRLDFRRLLDQALQGGPLSQGRAELTVVNDSGLEIPVEISVAPIERVGARFLTLYIHDVSSRKQAEQEIKSLARLASESPNPILRVGSHGAIVYANPASRPLLDAWHIEIGGLLPEEWRQAVGTALALGEPMEREFALADQVYAVLLAPIRDLGYANLYARDITAVRRAEQEARQHQAELVHVCRLSTLGEIATGMAHELNQPLAAVINYANGCSRRLQNGLGQPDELIGAMQQIIAQAQRASEIIKRLRALVGKQSLACACTDLNQLVREVCAFLDFEIDRLGVSILLDLSEEPIRVSVDPVQIEQVVLNLVSNALDALEERPEGMRRLIIRTWCDRPWARLAVADTGPGIEPERLAGLFAPFVTTKPGGMGMGLAISQTIIEQHAGQIWAESIPGEGATFHVRLPLAAGPDGKG